MSETWNKNLDPREYQSVYLGRGYYGEGVHDPVRVLLTNLRDEESSHSGSRSSSERVSELEALKAVAALSLLTDDIEHLVDELSSLGVVSLGPVVSGSGLTEDEIVRSEELTEGASSD